MQDDRLFGAAHNTVERAHELPEIERKHAGLDGCETLPNQGAIERRRRNDFSYAACGNELGTIVGLERIENVVRGIERAVPADAAAGDRYPTPVMVHLDSERPAT